MKEHLKMRQNAARFFRPQFRLDSRISGVQTARIGLAAAILLAFLGQHACLAKEVEFNAVKFIESIGYATQAIIESDTIDNDHKISSIQWMLQESVDLKFTGQRVLGPSWQKASEEQRVEYNSLFAGYVLKIYPRALLQSKSGKFIVTGSRPSSGNETLVFSSVQDGEGESVEWTWRVRKEDEDYKIVDLLADGVSMTATLREEFNSIILHHDLDGLLEKLRSMEGQ